MSLKLLRSYLTSTRHERVKVKNRYYQAEIANLDLVNEKEDIWFGN
jgi:hypothetical protein